MILRENVDASVEVAINTTAEAVKKYLGQEDFTPSEAKIAGDGLIRAVNEHLQARSTSRLT
jgi:uroporphyrinogen-III synthase